MMELGLRVDSPSVGDSQSSEGYQEKKELNLSSDCSSGEVAKLWRNVSCQGVVVEMKNLEALQRG